MALNGVMIKINDIFDDLRHENNRLFNELLFANNYINALNAFKDHLFAIYCKCDTIVTEEDKQLTTAFTDQLRTIRAVHQKKIINDKIPISVVDVTDGQQTSRSNDHKKAIRKTPEEDNEDSDETYVNNNDKNSMEKKPKTTIAAMKIKFKANKSKVESKRLLKNMTYLTGKSAKRVATDRSFRCQYADCESSFRYSSLLDRHVTKIHGNSAAEAVRQQKLDDQQYLDPIAGGYVCPHADCGGKSYDTHRKFRQHTRHVHSCEQFPCGHDGCHKTFKTLKQVDDHRLTHNTVRAYHCPQPGCSYATHVKRYLRHHAVTHLADRPVYRCEEAECQRTFGSQLGLKNHVTREHRSPTDTTASTTRHTCPHPGCDKSYFTSTHLRNHMATHCSEPTLPCDQCSELFRSEWYLKKHVITVHQNKPYVKKPKPIHACEWPGCDYRGTRNRLNHHKTIHTGDKPYVCDWPECGKRFRVITNLREHKNVHSNLRPYACHWPGCSYRCSNSGNLAKHVKQSHPNK